MTAREGEGERRRKRELIFNRKERYGSAYEKKKLCLWWGEVARGGGNRGPCLSKKKERLVCAVLKKKKGGPWEGGGEGIIDPPFPRGGEGESIRWPKKRGKERPEIHSAKERGGITKKRRKETMLSAAGAAKKKKRCQRSLARASVRDEREQLFSTYRTRKNYTKRGKIDTGNNGHTGMQKKKEDPLKPCVVGEEKKGLLHVLKPRRGHLRFERKKKRKTL